MNFKANRTTKVCTILILFAADQGTANTRAEFCSHPPFPQITSLAGFCVDTSAKKTWKRQGKNQAEIWKIAKLQKHSVQSRVSLKFNRTCQKELWLVKIERHLSEMYCFLSVTKSVVDGRLLSYRLKDTKAGEQWERK